MSFLWVFFSLWMLFPDFLWVVSMSFSVEHDFGFSVMVVFVVVCFMHLQLRRPSGGGS